MQREVMMTGVGGQGIQLSAKTLALAAVEEGRQAMLLRPLRRCHPWRPDRRLHRDGRRPAAGAARSCPSAWAAFVMSPQYWPNRPASSCAPAARWSSTPSLVGDDLDDRGSARSSGSRPASMATEQLGAPMGAAMVLLGAFCAHHRPGWATDALVRGHEASSSRRTGPSTWRPTRRPCGPGPRRAPWPAAPAWADSGAGGAHERGADPGHRGHGGRALQGLRVVHPGLPARRAGHVRARRGQRPGHPLSRCSFPGCTACPACREVCPDFVFEVYRFDEPIMLPSAATPPSRPWGH